MKNKKLGMLERRVRQKPVQLFLEDFIMDDSNYEEMLYVRSQEERSQNVEKEESESI